MATHKLVVPIVADSAAFKRGLKESETAATKFESKIKESTHHVRREILTMGAAFIGVGGVIEALKKSVEAAVELDQATSQMTAQMKANGESARAYTGRIAEMNLQLERVGFTNAQSEEAFARLSRAAGDSGIALKYMGLTADLAASKHVALSAAALVVGKVIQGSTSALNRYGVIIPKGTSATDALRIAQEKLSGQAAAMAKPTEVFSTILTDLEAKIGRTLLPTIDKYMTRIENWIGQAQNQKKITDAVKMAITDLGDIINAARGAFDRIWPVIEKVKNAFGDWKPLIVAAGAALVAIGVLSPWTALAVGAVYVITHWQKVKTWFEDLWARLKAGFNILWDGLKVGAYKAALDVVEPFTHLPAFLGGWARKAKDSLNKGLDAIQSDMSKNVDTITAAWGQAGKQAGDTWADNIVRSLTKNQARIAAAAGATSDSASSATSDSRGQGGHSTGASKMSASEVKALVRKAGGSAAEADYLAAISGKESGRDSTVINDNLKTHDYSVGLFQINFRDMQNRWMRGGKPAAMALQRDPLAQAKYALSLLHSQGPSAWSTNTPAIQALLAGGTSGGGSSSPGSLPGDAASAAAADKAKTAAEKKAAAAAKAAASAAYRSWKENYFTPLDNEYKNDLLITDESKRLNKLQALHAKLAIDEKNASGKERQDLFNEETKVAGKIQALRVKMANAQKALIAKQHAAYVKGLQDDLASAQTALTRQQTLFDRSWSRIVGKITAAFNKATQTGLDAIQKKYGAATPEEQARDAFQAQLDAAKGAAELAAAQDDLISAQLAGDPNAVQAAQARLDDIQNQQKLGDLQAAADKSRTIANAAADKETADYQAARDDQLANLNDWLDDQKTALENGTETWAQFWQAAFSDAPAKYAPDAVTSLQGVIDQLQRIKDLQDKINNATGGGGSGSVSLPGGLTVPAGVIGHGFGGSFAAGGIVPGSLGQPMMILAHGGERVIPNGGGGGDVYVTVNAPNYVGSKQELGAVVRDALVKIGRREPDIFGGFA